MFAIKCYHLPTIILVEVLTKSTAPSISFIYLAHACLVAGSDSLYKPAFIAVLKSLTPIRT